MHNFLLVPMVILNRLPQLWFEAMHPNPLVAGESQRAVSEKLTATGEGLLAAQAEMVKVSMAMVSAVMRGRNPGLDVMQASKRIADAALAPASRQVRANAKRLTRKSRSRAR